MGGSHSSEEKGASAGIHTLGTRVDEPRFLLVTDLDHTLVLENEGIPGGFALCQLLCMNRSKEGLVEKGPALGSFHFVGLWTAVQYLM